MAQNFRSAFNGFNREDVVHYIEYLNAKHTAEVNQLNAEIDFLRGKLKPNQEAAEPAELAELKQALQEKQTAMEELERRCSQLEQERNAAAAAAQEAENRLAEALTAKTQAEADRDAATQSVERIQASQELEAYRRAERTERMARERAELVYRQANGALADATVKVDEAASQIGQMTDRVSAQLAQLQTAVTASKQALADAAGSLYSIRPGAGEE